MSANEDERELHLQRRVPFARELVWKAMTEPEHVNAWWGPDGFRNEAVSMDFRVGGIWTFTMVGPDGTLIKLRQRYASRAARDEVVDQYGALEGGRQHLAKLEAYLRDQWPADAARD
jgi:hypothetical protein